jgi:hypothetical protein
MMRDYRDAKVMARALRSGLTDQGVKLTHSQSLELMAKAFGYDNWNILAAKIETERPAAASPDGPKTLYCSFCGKSQHEVKKLIAGPASFICDTCVGLCSDIIEHGEILALLADGGVENVEAYLAGRSRDQLAAYLAKAEADLVRARESLATFERVLEARRRGDAIKETWLDLPEDELVRRRTQAGKPIAGTERIIEIVTRMLETA